MDENNDEKLYCKNCNIFIEPEDLKITYIYDPTYGDSVCPECYDYNFTYKEIDSSCTNCDYRKFNICDGNKEGKCPLWLLPDID